MTDPLASREVLVHLLEAYSPMALAFSGGLDSRFLAYSAKELFEQGVRVHLYFFWGPHMSMTERLEAERWADRQGLPFTVLHKDLLSIPELRCNGQERCYHCKLHMFRKLHEAVAKNSPFPGQHISFCDGSNASDRCGYRPGLRALKELSIHSPLAEAGLTKEDIQKLSALYGLDRPFQRARPCLITRFAYNLAPDAITMQAVGEAETAIQDILDAAIADGELALPVPDFRLRLLDGPDPECGIEGDALPENGKKRDLAAFSMELQVEAAFLPPDLEERLSGAVTRLGFAKPRVVFLDQVSGYYDRMEGRGLV